MTVARSYLAMMEEDSQVEPAPSLPDLKQSGARRLSISFQPHFSKIRAQPVLFRLTDDPLDLRPRHGKRKWIQGGSCRRPEGRLVFGERLTRFPGSRMTLHKLTRSARLTASAGALASFVAIGLATPTPAHAELKLCNSTSSRIGVAIGYKDKDGWTSEGWWNVDCQSCALLIQDKLRARFYYVYAFDYDKGGEWGGPIPMCTNDVEFTIKGIENCEGRAFKKSFFFEVDTQEQTDWTVKLTDQSEPAATPLQSTTSPAADQAPAPAQAAAVTPPGSRKR